MKAALLTIALLATPHANIQPTQDEVCAAGGGCYTFTVHAIELMLEHARRDGYVEGLGAAKCRPPT